MNGILEITFKGKKERLRLNNYAREVLRRYFAGDKPYLTNGELMQAIIDKWKESEHLLLKKLVYAGIVGDSLVNNDTVRISEQEIGEYVGEAPPDELRAIWKEILAQQGFDLTLESEASDEEPEELTPEEEKKKTKIT